MTFALHDDVRSYLSSHQSSLTLFLISFALPVSVSIPSSRRFLRRYSLHPLIVRRDIIERGRDVSGVIKQYEKFVKPSFDEFILPVFLHLGFGIVHNPPFLIH